MENVVLDDELKKEFETQWDLELLNNSDELAVGEEEYNECLPKPEHLNILSKCFGHKKFRPMQWKIINSIITERRDNCAIMTTGYGKSLCYQFPAVYMGRLALIISPLISLMEDQVLAMEVSSISACLLGTANQDQKQTIDDILEDKYSLVYLTPEFCTGEYGRELLHKIYTKLSVALIAVDEAHCISSWGHDFRFQYRNLGILKDIMPDVPILAVTATATEKVKNDIIKTLKLRNPQITCSGFDRPNLYFSVYLKSPNIVNDLRKLMARKDGQWKFSGSTIIYCITRKQTEEISMLLSETGIKCLPYHAGLSINVRKDTHEKFVRDKIDVIVATIAFGMGIDKPDVRNIIHYGASNSIEGYYQEVGRAGRDGLPATCTTFYSNKDFVTLRFLNEKCSGNSGKENRFQMIDLMRDYLSTTECRRQYILSYFADKKKVSNTRCCDNCFKTPPNSSTYESLDEKGRYDFTEDAETFLKTVNALGGKFGMNMYVSFLRGSKMNKLSGYIKHELHGTGKNKSEAWWKGIAVLLEKEKYLDKVNSQSASGFAYSTTRLSKKGDTFLKDNERKLVVPPIPELLQCLKTKANIWLSTSESEPLPNRNNFTNKNATEDKYKESDMKLYNLLMNKRYELATSHNCMPYTIASNVALMEMAKQKPISLEHMRKCQLEGFTEAKIVKFGEDFIKIVRMALNLSADKSDEKMSIEDILYRYPLSEMKNNTSAFTSYSLFKAGHTINDISRKRSIAVNTVVSHLIDVMKLGYPIKLTDLGITIEIMNTITEAIKKVDTGLSLLTPIKNICPPDITYNQIKAVVTYLQIRQHLKKINIPYTEFDDIDSTLDIPSVECQPSTSRVDEDSKCSPPQSTPNQNLELLIKGFEELEEFSGTNWDEEGQNSNFSEGFNDELLAKACDDLETSIDQKGSECSKATPNDRMEHSLQQVSEASGFNFSVLDSPPRSKENHTVEKNESESNDNFSILDSPPSINKKHKIEESQSQTSNTNKKIKLPPWLMSKRIA